MAPCLPVRPGVSLAVVAGGLMLALGGCDRQPASRDAPQASRVATAMGPPPPLAGAPVATPPLYASQQLPLLAEPVKVEKPRRIGIHTPSRGSADRVALMNALRGQVRGELGGEVIFVVRELKSDGQWAFGVLQPTWPDGQAIPPAATPIGQEKPDLDGLRTEAIWRKERGRWTVFAHNIGSTDAWWLDFCPRVPKGLMPGC